MSDTEDMKYTMGFLLSRAAAATGAMLGAKLTEQGLDITPEQWVVINTLWHEKSMNQQALADMLSKNKTSISRLVDGLEKKGLVERCGNPEDRRDKVIILSKQGATLRNKGIKLAHRSMDEALNGISRTDIENMSRILCRINSNVRDSPDE